MKIKCCNCGSKDLKRTSIFCPTDDGFVDYEKAYVNDNEFQKIQTYLCNKCGHIEFYAVKKRDGSKENKFVIG